MSLPNGDGLAAEVGLILLLLRPPPEVLLGRPLPFPFTFLDADGFKVSGVEDREPRKKVFFVLRLLLKDFCYEILLGILRLLYNTKSFTMIQLHTQST